MARVTIITKILAVLSILLFSGCASSGSSIGSGNGNEEKEELTLRQHLERTNGVHLRGKKENTRIVIRASGSLYQNRGKQPLFVVDGNPRGRNFYRIASNLNPKEIVSVEVLRGAGANMYGSRGGQGVIAIDTTRDN